MTKILGNAARETCCTLYLVEGLHSLYPIEVTGACRSTLYLVRISIVLRRHTVRILVRLFSVIRVESSLRYVRISSSSTAQEIFQRTGAGQPGNFKSPAQAASQRVIHG